MNYEEFRDLTRESKDRILFGLMQMTTTEQLTALLDKMIVELGLQEQKPTMVFSKEKSIDEYYGLNVQFPVLPEEVKQFQEQVPNLKILGMMLLDPADYYCDLELTSDEIVAMAGKLPNLFNEAVSRAKSGSNDLTVEQLTMIEYGIAQEPIKGFKMTDRGILSFYGDPDLMPLCVIWHDDDAMLVYPNAWVAFVKRSATADTPKSVNVYRFD